MSLAEEVHVNRSLYCFENNSGRPASSGVFAGDDPLKFYFPLLLYHICIIFILSHAMYAVFRRVGIPLVISQILVRTLSALARPCMPLLCPIDRASLWLIDWLITNCTDGSPCYV